MKESARYVMIVEWSDEDRCFAGSCPGLLFGGCHGDNEVEVFEQLCAAVDDAIDLYRRDGKPLPPPTYASKMLSVASAGASFTESPWRRRSGTTRPRRIWQRTW